MLLQYRAGFVVIVAAVAHLVIAGPCVGKVNRHDTVAEKRARSKYWFGLEILSGAPLLPMSLADTG